ncbi:NYN domain-containing protein [uncultured Nevskia sp.]|uniref:NYN domain-containing protein n=1 Tax=uncultured Nevskia sp. TaxID=228950 RepID=UPI0025E90B94|nr:NYN domain-containing protein [uncultured Nevskia sp.]
METSPQAQLAVLIDADNANAKRIDGLLAEVAKYGRATTKRAYGDWTTQNLGSWKQTLARHAIQPMQQFSNTKGKNSTDSALIIDAMDLLYTERFDGFCIVSSDSDFTRLASRIRESGLTVYGFGERKTPQPFVRACDRFIFVEVLRDGEPDTPVEAPPPRNAERAVPPPGRGKPVPPAPVQPNNTRPPSKPAEGSSSADERPARGAPIDDPALLGPLRAAVADAGDEDGWVGLGAVGSLLSKRMPEFDPRNYGRKKLSDLIAAIPLFEVEERGEPGRSRALFIREKRVREGGDVKPEQKIEARPEFKPESKPEAKFEPKPEFRFEPKAEAIADVRAEAPPEAPRAQPKHEPRPQPLHEPRAHQPKPPQQPPSQPAPRPQAQASHEGEKDWAPRRDDRRPSWAIPKPAIAADPVVAPPPAPAVVVSAEPIFVAPAAAVAEKKAEAAPRAPRKQAPKKAVAKAVEKAAPVKAAEPVAADPAADPAAAKPRRRTKAAAPGAGE